MRNILIAFAILLLPSSAVADARVKQIVARQAAEKLGPQWVETALRIAELESGFRCNATGPRTRGGRAMGVMQVMPGSAKAMGFNPRRLHDCEYGVAAGIAHMRLCIAYGVRTPKDMGRCHVAGVGGWKKKLRKNAEAYKQKYASMVAGRRM